MKTHDWQPIETAPPDQLIRIMEKETKWVGTGIRKVYIDADDHVESYCQVLHYNGDVLVNRFYATHWMPTTPATSEAQTCIHCGHRESRQIPKQCVDDECFCVCVFPDTTPISGAVAAQPVSDPTVTVSASGVDPSLPTHCDHGVSLDDPCYMCRTATPSVSAAIAVVEKMRDEWAEELDHPNAFTVADQVAKTVWATERIITALRALPPDARAVDGDARLGVTPEVAEKLLRIREALAHDDIHEAWHWLYKIADSQVESLTPWAKLEACAAAITATKKETK